MAQYIKPLPQITAETREFWEGCKRHELLIQRCKDCGVYRHYPRLMCPKCGSWNVEWVKVGGRGKVYTWTVAVQPFHPGFFEDVPYAVVIVELEEGVRMVSNIVDCAPEEIYIGMPVEVVFDDVTEEVTLPRFRTA
ncbi:MAG: Zn-ribbon domain-containing OB-fold protein [Dehalococcoidia bacterium]|nr:Zn-ribbon domain-containing OB-fold protein [Dehalococcoidia bacterium]